MRHTALASEFLFQGADMVEPCHLNAPTAEEKAKAIDSLCFPECPRPSQTQSATALKSEG